MSAPTARGAGRRQPARRPPRAAGCELRQPASLELRAFIALIVLIIVFALLSDSYLTWDNLVTMTKHVAINAILAIGMLMVILTGGIDLSVGSIVGSGRRRRRRAARRARPSASSTSASSRPCGR